MIEIFIYDKLILQTSYWSIGPFLWLLLLFHCCCLIISYFLEDCSFCNPVCFLDQCLGIVICWMLDVDELTHPCVNTSLYVIDMYYRFLVWVPAMFRPCCIHQIQAMFRSCCIHQIVQHLCDQTIYSTRAYFEQGHAAVSATIQIQH